MKLKSVSKMNKIIFHMSKKAVAKLTKLAFFSSTNVTTTGNLWHSTLNKNK